MADYSQLLEDLERRRDELKLQIHLGTKEAQAEYEKLEAQWKEFAAKARLQETGEGLGDALGAVGEELVKGFERLKKAL